MSGCLLIILIVVVLNIGSCIFGSCTNNDQKSEKSPVTKTSLDKEQRQQANEGAYYAGYKTFEQYEEERRRIDRECDGASEKSTERVVKTAEKEIATNTVHILDMKEYDGAWIAWSAERLAIYTNQPGKVTVVQKILKRIKKKPDDRFAFLSMCAKPIHSNVAVADYANALVAVESFARTALPNAYKSYLKAKDNSLLADGLVKEMSAASVSKPSDGDFYVRSLKKQIDAFIEFRKKYESLCSYYLQHRLGFLGEVELRTIDANGQAQVNYKTLSPRLYETLKRESNEAVSGYEKRITMDDSVVDFAKKFLPNAQVKYNTMQKKADEESRRHAELWAEIQKFDLCYMDSGLSEGIAQSREKIKSATDKLSHGAKEIKNLYIDHRVGDRTAEDVSKMDLEIARNLE